MIATMFTLVARPGNENAILALFEEWRYDLNPASTGFVASEVWRVIRNPRSFVSIARFENEAALRAVASRPAQDGWYRRLVALTEREPVFTDCDLEWSSR